MNRREFLAAAAAAPVALRGRSCAARPRYADLEAAVVVVDPYAGRVVRRIATRPDSRSIQLAAATAIVAHTLLGEVSLLEGLTVRSVLREFDEPRYTAATLDGRHAHVTDWGSAVVAVVDVVRGQVVSRLRLGGWPRHVSLDSSGRRLWVALGTEARELAVVDVTRPDRPRLVTRVRPFVLAHDVVQVPGTRHVWVTSGDPCELAVYDARNGRVLRRLHAGSPPQYVAVRNSTVYVTSGADGTVSLHRLRDARLLRTSTIPTGSCNVRQGPGRGAVTRARHALRARRSGQYPAPRSRRAVLPRCLLHTGLITLRPWRRSSSVSLSQWASRAGRSSMLAS